MKNLLIKLLLFFGIVVSNLGATNSTKIVVRSVEPPNYDFNPETKVYNSLGFGSTDAMLRFMTNQIYYVGIAVYQEDGSGGFDQRIAPYPGYHHPAFKDSETFEEFFYRTSNLEFQRQVADNGYRVDQRFTLKYIFYGQVGVVPQFAGEVTFTPENIGSEPALPYGTFMKLEKHPFTANELVWMPDIAKASLVVFANDGSILYNKSIGIFEGLRVEIPRKFITNGYTGTLTIALGSGISVMYSLADGSLITYPQAVQPLLGLSVDKGGQVKVTVSGGVPFMAITLRCFSNLSLPPHDEVLTLDNVGSASWTNSNHLPASFFKLTYGD